MTYCLEGRPTFLSLPGTLKYWQVQNELTVPQGHLLKAVRLVIPSSMRMEMLDKLHEGSQGVVKCRVRAKSSLWWSGLRKQLEELVTNCTRRVRERHIHAESIMTSESRLQPWQNVATDMFVYKGRTYLFVVDYYNWTQSLPQMSLSI